MAAPVIQYKTLDEVKRTPAYKNLDDVQKAVVRLLFFLYENSHSLNKSLYIESSNAVKTLYNNAHNLTEHDIIDALNKLLKFEDDRSFMEKIQHTLRFYHVVRPAVETLSMKWNWNELPARLPLTVVPPNEPNKWVSEEHRIMKKMSQEAYDAAESVIDADKKNEIIDQKTLRRYITHMKRELDKPFWRQLERHAEDDQQSLEAYNLNKQIIEEALAIAEQMRDPPEGPTTRFRSRSRSRSRFRSRFTSISIKRQAGGKQPSNRRTMRRQQYKRRRRTLHRR